MEEDYEAINTENWLQVGDEKKPGVRLLARVPENINAGGLAFFKYKQNDQEGPIAANEYIAARLGQYLRLPVAKVQLKEFDGKQGALSYQVAPGATPWNQIPSVIKTDLPLYLNEYEALVAVTTFDVFINNPDRHGDNFMLSKLATRQPKYQFHMIDHGHSLLGASTNAQANQYNFPSHIQLPELQALKRHGLSFFEDALNAIRTIPEEFINTLVASVPDQYLNPDQKGQTLSMLLDRQQTLYTEFSNYLSQ